MGASPPCDIIGCAAAGGGHARRAASDRESPALLTLKNALNMLYAELPERLANSIVAEVVEFRLTVTCIVFAGEVTMPRFHLCSGKTVFSVAKGRRTHSQRQPQNRKKDKT